MSWLEIEMSRPLHSQLISCGKQSTFPHPHLPFHGHSAQPNGLCTATSDLSVKQSRCEVTHTPHYTTSNHVHPQITAITSLQQKHNGGSFDCILYKLVSPKLCLHSNLGRAQVSGAGVLVPAKIGAISTTGRHRSRYFWLIVPWHTGGAN